MMSMTYTLMTIAVFWSVAQGIYFSSSWSRTESPVSSRSASRHVYPINYRLPDNIVPNSYKIQLILEMDDPNFTFHGRSEISISVTKPTKQITFHAKNLDIHNFIKLTCHLNENPRQVSTFDVTNESFDKETDFLTIFLDKELLVGSNCILILSYSSTATSSHVGKGIYRNSYSENGTIKRMVLTQFEPVYARRAFPCWDEPALRANFTLSIQHTRKYIALSNMHVAKYEENPKDPTRIITHFARTPKMSTYLVVLAIGDFATVALNNTSNFQFWARKSVIRDGQYIQEMGPKLLNLLENYVNVTYKEQGFEKLKLLAVPEIGFRGAMENWGLITWGESEALLQKNSSSFLAKQRCVELLVHELTHQWFGNMVTVSWWNYTWLKEGMATYFEHIFTDQIEPKWRMNDWFVTKILQSIAFDYDSITSFSHAMNFERNSPDDIERGFNKIAYHKAACVIRMISHVLGEKKFQTALKRYIKNHAFRTATSDELLWSLADNDQDSYDFMWNWVNVPGYPVVTVTRNYTAKKATITQLRYLKKHNKTSIEKYYIPLNYVTEDKLDFEDTTVTHWFQPYWNTIEIDELNSGKFVIFNKQQFGYYRVNYDERNWRMIANYLRTQNHENIHVINRAQLIDDAFHLAKVNLLKYNVALSLIGYLERETNYVVWNAVWRSIESTYQQVKNTAYADNYKRYILHVSNRVLDKLLPAYLNEDNNLMKISKNFFFHWLCILGSTSCITESSKEFNKWLDNSKKNPETPLPARWILCGVNSNVYHEMLHTLWKIYLNERKLEFFQVIECTSDVTVFASYLSETIANISNKSVDFSNVFSHFISAASQESLHFVLDFIIEHYKEIITLDGYSNDELKLDLSMLGKKLNHENQLDKLTKFFVANNILDEAVNATLIIAKRGIRVLNERSMEFKEFFGKDIYYVSSHAEQKMQRESWETDLLNSTMQKLLRSKRDNYFK